MPITRFPRILLTALVGSLAGLAVADSHPVRCDDSLEKSLKLDAQSRVVLIKSFRKGEPVTLSGSAKSDDGGHRMMGMGRVVAPNDLCLVKLLVGPGNPGPADAPSTSPGIGIEIWLPAPEQWNNRIHALGGGGWDGGKMGLPMHVGDPTAAMVAGMEGAVTSRTDGGHPDEGGLPGNGPGGGHFGMNPDGSLNTPLLRDFAARAVDEQARKTKQVTEAYYGKPARYSYFEGASNGGRQAYKLAQEFPEHYDGIVGSMPAINWSAVITSSVYPHVVYQRDLGGKPIPETLLDKVSRAAIAACDVVNGVHLGYILDPKNCRYDPTKDSQLLCGAGKTANDSCLTHEQALAINKIWYGPTRDGSVPDPQKDNGWTLENRRKHGWFGLPRGTSLYNAIFSKMFRINAGWANEGGPFTHGTDMLALVSGNPTLAADNFRNAQGNGEDGWQSLSYSQLFSLLKKGKSQQKAFGYLDSNNPNLKAFKKAGGKLLSWHGVHDEALPVQGTLHYFDRVAAKMGGVENLNDFYRFYMIPGVGHMTPNGSAIYEAKVPVVPGHLFYAMVTDWVEKGIEPGRIELSSSPSRAPVHSVALCPYPEQSRYQSGDPTVATSYRCE